MAQGFDGSRVIRPAEGSASVPPGLLPFFPDPPPLTSHRHVLPTDRRRLARLDDEALLYLLGTGGDVLPVRAMEEALRRGPALGRRALELLIAAPEIEGWDPLWLLVFVGRFADPRHTDTLVRFLAQIPPEDPYVFAAAVEALAAAGQGVEDRMLALRRSRRENARVAAWGVLGLLGTSRARRAIEKALLADPSQGDLLVPALESCGSPESIEVLGTVLPHVPPLVRREVENAIRTLVHGERRRNFRPADWRLRYRCDRFWPVFDPGWVGAVRLERHDPDLTVGRVPVPLRSLDEIMAEAREAGPRGELHLICYLCGEPAELRQGIESCEAHAAEVRLRQMDLLERLVDEVEEIHAETMEEEEPLSALEDPGDLFSLLVYAEAQWKDLAEEQDVVGGAGRPDELRSLDWDVHLAHVLVDTLRGLIAEGVETLDGAWPRLLPGASVHPAAPLVEGGAMVLAQARFRVVDPALVHQVLSGCEELRVDARNGSAWTWVDPSGALDLGRVEHRGHEVVLECLTEERLARGRAFLERIAGHELAYLGSAVQGAMDPLLELGWGRTRGGGEDEATRWN